MGKPSDAGGPSTFRNKPLRYRTQSECRKNATSEGSRTKQGDSLSTSTKIAMCKENMILARVESDTDDEYEEHGIYHDRFYYWGRSNGDYYYSEVRSFDDIY